MPSGVDRTDKAQTDRDLKDPSTEDNSVLPEQLAKEPVPHNHRHTLPGLRWKAANPKVARQIASAKQRKSWLSCRISCSCRICFLWKMEEMIENLKSDRENSADTGSAGQDATVSEQQPGRVAASKGQAKASQAN